MLDIVCFKWSMPGYRTQFTARHVNVMLSMIARHYKAPFRFHCFTDDVEGIATRVRIHELWDTFADIPNPHGGNNPSCYRRLLLWDKGFAAAKLPGATKILQIDLDMVLVDDVRPLWDRPEPVVMWADNLNPTSPYNGAMQLYTPGARPQVVNDFRRDESPKLARAAGYFGSDQAWLAYALGPNEARWRKEDGAVSWRVHCRQTPPGEAHLKWRDGCLSALPPGARCVNFHGLDDPSELVGRVPWITEHYR